MSIKAHFALYHINQMKDVLANIVSEIDDIYYYVFPLSPVRVVIVKPDPDRDDAQYGCSTPVTNSEQEGGDDEWDDEWDDESTITTRSNCPTRVIRVLFLFTNNAGASGLNPNAVSNLVIDELNTSSIASGLPWWQTRFELANVVNINTFIESFSIGADLNAIATDNTANTLRATNLADLVVLLTDASSCTAAGRALDIKTNLQNAYSIAQIRAAAVGFTGTHEIGHMMGARHQRCIICPGIGNPANFITGCDEIGRGHGYPLAMNARTIMYQNGCSSRTRIGRWSNVSDVHPFGITGSFWNNNARALKNHSGTVSCFFPPPPQILNPNAGVVVNVTGSSNIEY